MKALALPVIALASFAAFAQPVCDVVCTATTSATYEAGYTEEYSRQTVRLNGRSSSSAAFSLEGISGTLSYDITATGSTIGVRSDAVNVTGTVSFPEGCSADRSVFAVRGSFLDTSGGDYVSERDLNVECRTVAASARE